MRCTSCSGNTSAPNVSARATYVMSTVFFDIRGQPTSQRPRLSQPCWKTPLNGWRRSAPKCTAIGSASAVRPAFCAIRSKAATFGSGGSAGTTRGSSACSVRV